MGRLRVSAVHSVGVGGCLRVVEVQSNDDRMVKRLMQVRASLGGGGSRYAPAAADRTLSLVLKPRRAIGPDPEELDENPRARSAKLRVARRTEAELGPQSIDFLGLPPVTGAY